MKKTRALAAEPKDKLLPKITMAFFKRPRTTALIWLVVVLFGVVSYTSLLRREGFPSVTVPLVIVNGSYAVNNASQVDQSIAKTVSDIALKQDGVSSVTATSQANFFSAAVQYDDSTDVTAAKKKLETAVRADSSIPTGALLSFDAPYFGVTGGSLEPIDATISVYSLDNSLSLEALNEKAEKAAAFLNAKNLSQVEKFSVNSPFESVKDPVSGQSLSFQQSFDTYAKQVDGKTQLYKAVIINVAAAENVDVIKLDAQITPALEALHEQSFFDGLESSISASYAPTITQEISELQKVLLEGLLAVLVIGSIVIAVRASFITVLAMVTVITITVGLLYLFGYTLNVITLFALILGLSLIVDDTIIMTEAIDAARRKNKRADEAVLQATRKISRAMVAATLTAALSFAPLLFVGGILGGFIRAIPVTIISALLVSLIVALVFIPLFAKFILLGKKQLGSENVKEFAAGFEARIAHGITAPMRWAKHSRRKEFAVGLTAVFIGLGFIFGGAAIFRNVAFDIFPASKDTNQIAVELTFKGGVDISRATEIADTANAITTKTLGDNLVSASNYGTANAQTATLNIDLISYEKRDVTAPQLVDTLTSALDGLDGAAVKVYAVGVGGPTDPFTVQIDATDRAAAITLADDLVKYLETATLTRTNGTVARFNDPTLQSPEVYARADGEPKIKVTASFDGTDTTALTNLAQSAIKDRYTKDKLETFGLSADAISFNLGQESDNQNSFKSLAIAFPILLFVIYLLLAVQFRSLLQPLLIFLALPFSFFGIALGLYLTDNPFSFFAMLGFFALIGLSIKNTILLTDYANQSRLAGAAPVDAVVDALGERFRPLIATSLTAVVSLIPLAITSPFWQGLAVVLIGGLLSSTFLVITVFPYYYLGAEFIRIKTSNLVRRIRARKGATK